MMQPGSAHMEAAAKRKSRRSIFITLSPPPVGRLPGGSDLLSAVSIWRSRPRMAYIPIPMNARDPDLRSLSLEATTELVAGLGEPRYRGEQIWRWVHGRRVRSWDQMANVPRSLRERLAAAATLGGLSVAEGQ